MVIPESRKNHLFPQASYGTKNMSGSFFHVLLSCACNLYFVNRRCRRCRAFCFSRFQSSVFNIRNISVSFVRCSPNIYNILLVTFSKLYLCLQEDTEKFSTFFRVNNLRIEFPFLVKILTFIDLLMSQKRCNQMF